MDTNFLIPHIDESLKKICKKRLDNLTKPKASLGRLEELAISYCCMRGNFPGKIEKKAVLVFAADHGIVDEGISAYPQEVTYQMVYNFLKGGAGINVLARAISADVYVIDMGVKEKIKTDSPYFIDKKIAYGTRNFLKDKAMDEHSAKLALEKGKEVLIEILKKEDLDIIAVGDMGIGNTTPSSAITALICSHEIEEVTGRGTGIDDRRYKKKIEILKKALDFHKPRKKDPYDILSKVGGLEIAGIAGAILSAAEKRIPVMLDGFITTAAALIAYLINPRVKDYLFASHCSQEPGHIYSLEFLGLKPLFDLNLRLGEGTGACLGIFLVECGLKIMNEMASFEEAGVSKKDD